MASDIKIIIDTSDLDSITRVECVSTDCRFNVLGNRTCGLRQITIGKNGDCAMFEKATPELSKEFEKRLQGV